jgi:hypothetical protein
MAKFDHQKDYVIKTLNLGDSGYMIMQSEKNVWDYMKIWNFRKYWEPSSLKKKLKSKEQ